MQALEIVDIFLLGKSQRFAHKFQRLTGRTNFWLAAMGHKLVLFCFILFALVKLTSDFGTSKFLGTLIFMGPIYFISSLMLGFLVLMAVKRCEKKEIQFLEADGRTMNICMIMQGKMRSFLFLIVVAFMGLFTLSAYLTNDKSLMLLVIYFMFFIMAIYFESCTPLPPGKSKVKEWLESWKFKRKLVPVTNEN